MYLSYFFFCVFMWISCMPMRLSLYVLFTHPTLLFNLFRYNSNLVLGWLIHKCYMALSLSSPGKYHFSKLLFLFFFINLKIATPDIDWKWNADTQIDCPWNSWHEYRLNGIWFDFFFFFFFKFFWLCLAITRSCDFNRQLQEHAYSDLISKRISE